MTSGTPERADALIVRKAVADDLAHIKRMCDANKAALGFVNRGALAASIARAELLCATLTGELCGFVEYHHRRAEQTTLYHLVVEGQARSQGVGAALVAALAAESHSLVKRHSRRKCPMTLDANGFYARLGFERTGVQAGKAVPLQLWHLAT